MSDLVVDPEDRFSRVAAHMMLISGKKKPYTSTKGESGEEDRHVAEQPLTFGDNVYNLRTLNNLPYHRIHARQLDIIKQECLVNYEFLLNKVKALPLM